ncbi:MAG: ABC transporter ATP-binding protein [Acholeplasmataceae bacterium]
MKDFKDFTRERSDKEVLKRLVAYLKPHMKLFILTLVLMVFSLAVQLLPPLMLGIIVNILGDSGVEKAEQIRQIVTMSVIFFVLIGVVHVITYYQSMFLQKIGQKVVVSIREEVFTHIENLSISQINKIPVGKLVTRVCNDTNSISEMYSSVAVNLIRNLLYLVAILVVLFILNWKITLYVLAVIPFVILASVIFRRFSRASYRRVRANLSEVNAFLSENLSGMKVTQIFNQEEKKKLEFREKSGLLRNSYLQEIFVFGIYRPSVYFFSMVAIIIVLYFGTDAVIAGALLPGFLYSYYSYVNDFFQPIQQIAEQFNMLQNAFASAEKIFDVLDTDPEITDVPDAINLETFTGSIEFRNVWFAYVPDVWVLKDVSFKVKPGETIAFVGATGSGKTTILSLIVRNYEIQKGQILIDGHDIKTLTRSSLRSHIGQMLQDVFLFSGTIAENINLKDENIAIEEVVEASEYVGANTFIDSFSDGYSHVVLERGNNFSSGQRQLISFARAVAYKPSLMILDEATANIDSETESLIQTSLEKMMNISTMLIVAHRLSTIQHSDRIMVMQKGEIKESGSHQELLSLKGLYYNLYQLQYDEKEENKEEV